MSYLINRDQSHFLPIDFGRRCVSCAVNYSSEPSHISDSCRGIKRSGILAFDLVRLRAAPSRKIIKEVEREREGGREGQRKERGNEALSLFIRQPRLMRI